MKALLNLFRKRTITNRALKLTIEHINQQRSTTYGTRNCGDTRPNPTQTNKLRGDKK